MLTVGIYGFCIRTAPTGVVACTTVLMAGWLGDRFKALPAVTQLFAVDEDDCISGMQRCVWCIPSGAIQ